MLIENQILNLARIIIIYILFLPDSWYDEYKHDGYAGLLVSVQMLKIIKMSGLDRIKIKE
jgi:hypothetical protein